MTQTTISRSVLETSTRGFKDHFREYLHALAKDIDPNRVQLINALEWCFDRWEHWRQKFYPGADLKFPFFQSGRRGSEFGHYSTCGSSGQPSVIHIKRSYLMGSSDITVWKLSPTRKLVLKADHPDRLKFVDQTILHELVHQYLFEASPNAAEYESKEAGRSKYKGHGPLFAAECNRINKILHPELGFEFVPVRHAKRSHARIQDVQRPSCAHFTHGELLFAWDPGNPELTSEQIQENRDRLDDAMAFYGGAVELVQEAEEVVTDFAAPFASDCADVCVQQLKDYDRAHGTDLLAAFVRRITEDFPAASAVPANIPPADRHQLELVADPGHPVENKEPSCIRSTVPTAGDGPVDMRAAYPLSDPANSLAALNARQRELGLNDVQFAQTEFGHKAGDRLSKHRKKLRNAIQELVA